MIRSSSMPCLCAASPLTDRTSSAAKEAKLPAAARIHSAPALSARDANSSPAMNSAGLMPFIAVTTRLSLVDAPDRMLAPPSDRKAARRESRRAGTRGGGAA